jgi:hypothetical protein
VVQQVFRKVAMGIDDGHAVASMNVLDDEVSQQRGFSRSRLSDDVGVVPSVLQMQTKRNLTAPSKAMTDEYRIGG